MRLTATNLSSPTVTGPQHTWALPDVVVLPSLAFRGTSTDAFEYAPFCIRRQDHHLLRSLDIEQKPLALNFLRSLLEASPS